eukprot:2354550-Amphidinium_carterae.1
MKHETQSLPEERPASGCIMSPDVKPAEPFPQNKSMANDNMQPPQYKGRTSYTCVIHLECAQGYLRSTSKEGASTRVAARQEAQDQGLKKSKNTFQARLELALLLHVVQIPA